MMARLVRLVRLRRRVVRVRCIREAGSNRGGERLVVVVVRVRLRKLAAGGHGENRRVVVGLWGPPSPGWRRVRSWRGDRNGDVETRRSRGRGRGCKGMAGSGWGDRRG